MNKYANYITFLAAVRTKNNNNNKIATLAGNVFKNENGKMKKKKIKKIKEEKRDEKSVDTP